MEPDFDEHAGARELWLHRIRMGSAQAEYWTNCRTITVRRSGRTLCRFYEPHVMVALGGERTPTGPDGWWRLRCDPIHAKQWRAMGKNLGQPRRSDGWLRAAGNYARMPLVRRARLDAAGNLVDYTPIVVFYDLEPGDSEVVVFPKPLGGVPATALYPVLTKFADHSIAAVELGTVIEAINRNK
jgi:hypothetical protein